MANDSVENQEATPSQSRANEGSDDSAFFQDLGERCNHWISEIKAILEPQENSISTSSKDQDAIQK
jgi:hypothetical protein